MAVKVNGDAIPDQAIEFELSRLVRFYSGHMDASEIRKQMDVLKERAKQQAIGAKLLIDEARRLDLHPPDDLVENQVQQMIKEAGGDEAFEEITKKQGLTIDYVRRNVAEGRRVDMLVEKLTEGLDDPTEEELEQHFEAHESEYTAPPRAHAQHILVSFDKDDEKAREEAHSKIRAIHDRLAEGSEPRTRGCPGPGSVLPGPFLRVPPTRRSRLRRSDESRAGTGRRGRSSRRPPRSRA